MQVSKAKQLFGVFSVGALLAGGQLIVFRRALALSGGDEFVFAVTLTLWLLSMASGSALFRTLQRFVGIPIRLFRGLFVILSLYLFFLPLILPWLTEKMVWQVGTTPGAGQLLLPLFVTIWPFGIMGGMLFPLACRWLTGTTPSPVRSVYLWESVGAFIVGLATVLFFSAHISGIVLGSAFAIWGLTFSAMLFFPRLPVILTPILAIILPWISSPFLQSIETESWARLRPGQQVLDIVETPYGILEVFERQGQISLYENGNLMMVSDDPSTAEEDTYLTLVQHRHPTDVLWIGGYGSGGLLKAMEFPAIQRLTIVELNPTLIELADTHLPGYPINNGRLNVVIEDGRRFLNGAGDQGYDLIFIDGASPQTMHAAKYTSQQGLELAKRVLKPGGVLAFYLPASEDYIGKDLGRVLQSVYTTAQTVFDSVAVLPGERALFLLGDRQSRFQLSAEAITSRLDSLAIYPLYWDYYRLRDRISAQRVRELQEILYQEADISTDQRPRSFYDQQVFRAAQIPGGFPGFWRNIERGYGPGLIMLGLMIGIWLLYRRFIRRDTADRIITSWTVFTVGFAGISIEILMLTLYQVSFGSGYREVGLLTGCYMAGLAVGAWLLRRLKGKVDRQFRMTQMAWVIMPLAGMAVYFGAGAMTYSTEAVGMLLYYLFMTMTGIAGGLHFTIAMRLLNVDRAGRAGLYYGLDLAGAALGALLFGIFALPLLGLTVTCAALSLMSLFPLILLLIR